MEKLFEEYVESMDYKVSVFFKELKSQITKWFDEGSLAAQGCELDGEIQINNYNPMEKFLMCNFVESINEDDTDGVLYRYRMAFMVRLDQMNGDDKQSQSQFDEVPQGMQIPQGDMQLQGQSQGQPQAQGQPQGQSQIGESANVAIEINKVLLKIHQFDEENIEKGELVEEVSVEDIKEDFIIDKLGQLKNESEDESLDSNDLKSDVHVK